MSDEEFKQAKQRALRLLARREYSCAELRNKLELIGYSNSTIVCLLQQLTEQHWLSDQRFAEGYVRKRLYQGYGPRRIAGELREQGITSEHLSLNDAFWATHLSRVWRKRFKQTPQDANALAKQTRFLLYKGFDISQIKAFFKELKARENE